MRVTLDVPLGAGRWLAPATIIAGGAEGSVSEVPPRGERQHFCSFLQIPAGSETPQSLTTSPSCYCSFSKPFFVELVLLPPVRLLNLVISVGFWLEDTMTSPMSSQISH